MRRISVCAPMPGLAAPNIHPNKTRTKMLTDLNKWLTLRRTRNEHQEPPMASSSQQTRRLSSFPRLSGSNRAAGAASGSGQVSAGGQRWGAAIVSTGEPSASPGWREVSNRRRRGRRTTVWVDDSLPVATPSRVGPGVRVTARSQVGSTRVAAQDSTRQAASSVVLQLHSAPSVSIAADECPAVGSFAQNRVRHAFELFGACMMIAAFLAMAMFA